MARRVCECSPALASRWEEVYARLAMKATLHSRPFLYADWDYLPYPPPRPSTSQAPSFSLPWTLHMYNEWMCILHYCKMTMAEWRLLPLCILNFSLKNCDDLMIWDLRRAAWNMTQITDAAGNFLLLLLHFVFVMQSSQHLPQTKHWNKPIATTWMYLQ